MPQEEVGRGDPIEPLDWLKRIPFQATAASEGLGWVGLEAARYRASPAWEYSAPALTHHRLVLVTRPPQELDLRFEGIKRYVPPPVGAIILVPAGTPGQVRWSGAFEWLHIYLKPGLVSRVAAEAFDLDPARLTIPPLGGLDLPHLRATMLGVDAELRARGAGRWATRRRVAGQHSGSQPDPLRCHGAPPRARAGRIAAARAASGCRRVY
jgi:hypothetical protein